MRKHPKTRNRVKVVAIVICVFLIITTFLPVSLYAASTKYNINVTIKYPDGTLYNGEIFYRDLNGSGSGVPLQVSNGVLSWSNWENYKPGIWIGVKHEAKDTTYNDVPHYLFYTTADIINRDVTETLYIQEAKVNYQIKAKDSVNGGGIPGVTYVTKDKKGNAVSATTNASGIASFSLNPGTYTFSEVSVPKGYGASGSSFQISSKVEDHYFAPVKAFDAGVVYKMHVADVKENLYKYDKALDVSTLNIRLEDSETGEAIQNGRFDILNSTNAVVKSLTTNSFGEAAHDRMDNGTYTVKQTATDSKYSINDKSQSVTINKADKTITFKNNRKKGKIAIKITDSETGTPIPNAKFIRNGENSSQTLTTNSEGVISMENLKYGTYTLEEYELPKVYIPQQLSINLSMNDSTNGITYTYSYKKVKDTTLPSISFSPAPADNSVPSFNQVLTLTDDFSGIKELKIDGTPVFTAEKEGILTATFTHIITANKPYSYTLTDYAGNVYTTVQTIWCIINTPVMLSDPVLSNYKTIVSYNGINTYVVNKSHLYSNIKFDMSDKDITDTWSYKIELIDTEGCVIRQIIRSVSAPGSFTERILYQNSTTGMSVNDGLYKIVVTAYDKYCDSSTAIYVIVKHNKPPQPVIEHSLVSNMVSIEYPPDSFPAYALKQYSYLGDNVIYGGPFLVTARGFVTAIHEDIAGNKSTVMLQVSPPRQIGENETQTGLPPVMLPESGNGGATGAGVILEETRNCYIYYINFRGGINDPAAANAILGMIN